MEGTIMRKANQSSKDWTELKRQKNKCGSRDHRKLQKYSEKFNEIFNFFLKSYRSGILTFCGYDVKVEFDINSDNGKLSINDTTKKLKKIQKKLYNLRRIKRKN